MLLDPKSVAILLLSLLSVLTTVVGVMLALLIRENVRAIAVGIGFSTGIMVLISGLELIPEAHEAVGPLGAGLSVAFGVALLWAANFAIPHAHLVREHGMTDTRLIRSVYLVVVGLILHDVPEGFAMANAYIASPSLGLLVALAIALHNLPEELAMALPAMALRSKRFLIAAAMLVPMARRYGKMHWFGAGIALSIVVHQLLALAITG